MPNVTILNETIVKLSDPAHRAKLPGNPTARRLSQWMDNGVPERCGGTGMVFLEFAWLGGRRVTSQEAVARFHEAVNGGEG